MYVTVAIDEGIAVRLSPMKLTVKLPLSTVDWISAIVPDELDDMTATIEPEIRSIFIIVLVSIPMALSCCMMLP